MKNRALAALAILSVFSGPVWATDMPAKAKGVAAAAPPAWDIAFGSAVSSDYIWRGITQSNHKPSVAGYFEPRYKIHPDVELYAGLGANSISFPNRAAAEVDIYGGFRPTFGKLSLDFGAWYYWYPGGQCFNSGVAGCLASLPVNLNVAKANWSFWELYVKANYAITDALGVGAFVYYSPNVLNTGADGVFFGGTAKYTFAAFPNGVTPYVSGEVAHWSLGTSDAFYGSIAFKDYTSWNVGFGWAWKVFTVDLRYIDTNLSKGDCNAFTSDHTATQLGHVTPINSGGYGSNWCGARFVARLTADLTVNTNLK